ncbi:MAG: ABC transporter ATP-binding protein, partial [Flavobacteriales bacterium]
MLCDPKALILDEPTNGLDPEGIAQIREIIVNIAKTGKSIILASHLLDEVQKVCTDYCILRKGNLIHTGKVSPDMGAERRIAVNAVDPEKLQQVLSNWDKSLGVEKGKETLIATLQPQTETAELSQYLQANNIIITHLEVLKKSLEEQFLEIVKNS